MKVLVDSCVWSLALRRSRPVAEPAVTELRELIQEGRVQLIGPIRQETLSGIRHPEQFQKLREKLRFFPDLEVGALDFERAAEIFNSCRSSGIQGSATDFLLCAVAERVGMPILTTDQDFSRIEKHCSITLHRPRSSSGRDA